MWFGALVDALDGNGTLPPLLVVITFDDGRENQYEFAYPVLRKLGFTATYFPFTHALGRNPRYFTWEQFQELQAAGMTIGSHTCLHVKVSKIRGAAQMKEEVEGSRQVLRERLGISVDCFAYPWGVASVTADSAIREAGYRATRSFSGGAWQHVGTIMRLPAVPVTEKRKWDRYAAARSVRRPVE